MMQRRLVVTAHIAGRVLSLNGLDRFIESYPPWKQLTCDGPAWICGLR